MCVRREQRVRFYDQSLKNNEWNLYSLLLLLKKATEQINKNDCVSVLIYSAILLSHWFLLLLPHNFLLAYDLNMATIQLLCSATAIAQPLPLCISHSIARRLVGLSVGWLAGWLFGRSVAYSYSFFFIFHFAKQIKNPFCYKNKTYYTHRTIHLCRAVCSYSHSYCAFGAHRVRKAWAERSAWYTFFSIKIYT